MSTDLHERLHEALSTAEIPSYRATLAAEAVLVGRRARRRRRTLGALAGVAAVAASVVAAVVVLGPEPQAERSVPATTLPVTEQTGPTEAPEPPDAQTEVVDDRLQVATDIQVDGVPVVLVPEVYSPDGGSVVELVAEQSPRPDLSATGLAGSSVVVTADDDSPGWTVAAVVRPNGTYTGQVLVYGVLPTGTTELKTGLPDSPDLNPLTLVRVDGDLLPGAPVPAWGPSRDLFVLSGTDPALADQRADLLPVDVDVTVRARVGGEWVEVGRSVSR